MVDIYLQHGWGWDASGWDEWSCAEGYAGRCWVADQGYFGAATIRVPATARMVVAHSLGLHLVPPVLLATARWVVVFGGFCAFHADAAAASRRSRRMIQRMVRRLEDEPAALLGDFYRNAYAPQACGRAVPAGPDAALLGRDLALLDGHVFDPGLLRPAVKVLIVHGGQDRIVPLEQGTALHRKLPGSQFHIIEEAGHALPFTHGAACRRLINAVCEEWNDGYRTGR